MEWQHAGCHRSKHAGAPRAFAELIQPKYPQARFLHVACSGATTRHLYEFAQQNQQGAVIQGPQLRLVRDWMNANYPGRAIDALIVSAGVNDINFGGIVAQCIADNPWGYGNGLALIANPPFPSIADECFQNNALTNQIAQDLNALPTKLGYLASAIRNTLPVSQVYITEYPDPVRESSIGYCEYEPSGDGLANISWYEGQWASQYVVATLNAKIRDAAQQHGWRYVDGIASRFVGHAYCAPVPWINTVDASQASQGDVFGMLHPNVEGHKVYRDRIAEALFTWTLPPANLRLAGMTAGSVQLTWDDHAPSETAVEVRATTVGSGATRSWTLAANSTTWTHRADEGLAPGGTYDYQVRQCKAGSCSGWSKALRVAYTYAAPAAPTNLQQRCTSRYIAAVDEYVTECSLAWADNAGNEERYELLSQAAGASTWQTLVLAANTTSYKPAAGAAAARYYVRACDAAGCSAPSNTITWSDP